MAHAYITRRGGGSGKAFAAIGVTYPEGAICTCSNGTKTLTAKDTSGEWLFALPIGGDWTVTAIDGADKKSVTVSITTKGQVESITVLFNSYLFLDGNVYAEVTGGWSRASSSTSSGTVTVGKTMEVKSLTPTGAVIAITGKTIDLTPYSKLKIKIASLTKAGTSQTPVVRFELHNTPAYDAVSAFTAITDDGIFEIPLASLTNGYVALKVYYATVVVDSIWLE